MENEVKAAKILTGIVVTGSALIVGKACKYAYQAYKRKCFELEIAGGIISVQRSLIEDLLKENKKLNKKSKTEPK